MPLAHWSRAELARYVAATPSLPPISASTIGSFLAAEQIRPWRYHSWQHIQDAEAFLLRARPVLQLYEQAAALLQQGIWVVCTDEKTCIQAREAEQAPRPAIHEHPVYQSPRYHRHGVLHLMAALSVADGLVYGQCHPRKRFVDFRSFLETIVIAEACRRRVQTIALVLDNGPTHARHPTPRLGLGTGQDIGGKTDDAALVVAHQRPPFSIRSKSGSVCESRKLLQPNHFTSLNDAAAGHCRLYYPL